MKQKDFFKYLFHVQYNMPYILIQINENITKFFTLLVKGHLNKVMEFNMQYLHHHEIFAFTMKHKNVF
jgi:hypothetical protein